MLEIRVCGGVEVEVDGRVLPESLLGGRQGRLVLAYLACERDRAVRREELADLLWPEALPDTWTTSLSAVISRLRRLFTEAGFDGPSVLASTPGAYQLQLPAGARVDFEDLISAVAEAEDAAATGAPDRAIAAANRAEGIAARGFLADDCEWVDSRRDALRDLRVRAALAQSAAHLDARAHGRACEAARRALDLDDTKEAAYRQLMLALTAAGERGEALRVWERCRVTLVDELGIDPSPETEAVYLQLLDGTAPPPTTKQLPSGVVTFLLTDIVESTAMWDAHTEAMATALERHDDVVARVVAAHGGTLLKSKLEGDATVSVFARATEGASAALALLDALDAEPWPEAARPRVRMAMHTGEAFERGGDYFGPALNRAARLRGLADANQVLLSQAVAELVRDHLPSDVVLKDRGLQNLRGLSRGENVFELAKAGAAPPAPEPVEALTRPPVPGALAGTGPFVGRGSELAQLDELWARANNGELGAVFVGGEPGVGKSRLAGEIAQRAHAAGGLVLYGRCDEDLAAPLQPFIETVRMLAPAMGATRLRAVRGVDEITRVVPELTELLGEQPGTRADPDTERLALFDAVTQLLAAAAEDVPVLLVLDDLHWAGKTTLSLLRHVLRGAKQSRLLVVGTYRDTELARTHPLAETLADLRREADPLRITLGGLAEVDVAAYLDAIGNTDRELGRELAEVTAGNPFFLIEVVRHVEESGGVWQRGALPEGVREATGRRLSRLSDAANDALAVAAVVGARFDLALVEQVRGVELVDPIAEAVRAGLVVEETGSLASFRFAHALVRQVLLSELVSLKRVRLHRQIAELLEAAPAAADADARLADLAYHWFECASAGSADKAVAACRTAADRAMERLAYEEAGDLYGMALQALEWVDDADPEIGATLHLARCDALLTAGDVAGARDAIDSLEGAAAGSERLAAWYTTYEGLLAVLGEPDRLTEIVQSIGAAAGAMHDADDLRGEAKARYVHALALERLGQIGAAERSLDVALAAARSANDRRLADAILAEAPPAALWGPRPVTRASGSCLDVVRVLRITSGTPAVEAVALRCQAVLEALRGRTDAARRMIASSRRTVEKLGLTHRRLEAEMAAGLIELLAGEAETAERHLRGAYEGLRDRGLGGEAAQAAAFLGKALLIQGRFDEADDCAADAQELAGSDLKAAITWRGVRAEAALRRGDTDRALALAREAVELASATDALALVADARLTLAMVLRAIDDVAGADAEARRAVEACDAKGATVMAGLARSTMSLPMRETATPGAAPAVAAARQNLAWATMLKVQEAFNRADWDAIDALEARSINLDDRRPIVGIDRTGDELNFSGKFAHAGGGRLETPELLATTGHHAALCRWMLRGPNFEVPYLGVHLVNADGLLTASIMYAPEALDDALAALAEMKVEPNLAMANAIRVYQAFNRGDLTTVRALSSPTQNMEDRRLVVGLKAVGTDELAFSAELTYSGGGRFEPPELLATRGDHAVLCRWLLRGPTYEMPYLAVTRVDAAGLAVANIQFEPDALEEALAELAKIEIEPNLAVAAARNVIETYNRGDWDAMNALAVPGRNIDDRRPIVRMITDEHQDIEGAQIAFEQGGRFEPLEVVEQRGDHAALCRWAMRSASSETLLLGVTRVDANGAIVDQIWFEPEALDEAMAALTQVAEASLAMATSIRIAEAFNRADWDEMRRLVIPTGMIDDRRLIVGMTTGQDDAGLSAELVHAGGARFDPPELLDTRGDRVALIRWVLRGPNYETPYLAITRVAADGRVAKHIMFELEALDEARAEFAKIAVDELENDATRAVARVHEAFNAHDWDAARAQYTEDWTQDDRRSVVAVPLDRDQSIASQRIIFDGGGKFTKREVVAIRGQRCAVFRTTLHVPSPEVLYETLIVTRTDERGLTAESVVFDTDDVDGALAELDRMFAEHEGNEAWRTAERMRAALLRRDWEVFRAACAPDIVFTDNRVLSRTTLRAEEALTFILLDVDDVGMQQRLLATRGEQLALMRNDTWRVEGDAGRSEVSSLVVFEVGSDGLRHIWNFDGDDLDAAYAALDARYAELVALDSGNAAWRASQKFFDALNRRDWQGFLDTLDPNVTFADLRHAVKMTFTGENATDTWRALVDLDEFGVERELLTTRGDLLALTRERTWFRDGQAGRAEVDSLSLIECTREGLVASLTGLDADDLDAAYAALDARHAELAADQAGNAAWRATRRWSDALVRRDWDAFRTEFAPDFVYTDGRSGVRMTRHGEAAFDSWRLTLDLDEFGWDRTLLATRGELLALIHDHCWFVDGAAGRSEVNALTVVECSSGGLTRVTSFDSDDLDAAYEWLNARSSEFAVHESGNAAWLAAQRLRAALVRRDWPSFIGEMAPDLVFTDTRPGMKMTLSGDAALEAWRIVLELDGFGWDQTLLATRGEHLALIRDDTWSAGGDAGRSEVSDVSLIELGPEGVRRITGFDPDALDTAYAALDARYAELSGNQATLALERMCDAMNARDWDEFDRVLDPAFVSIDNRQGFRLRLEDAEGRYAFNMLKGAARFRVDWSLIETRGDNLALTRYVTSFEGRDVGPSEVPSLVLVESAPGGRISTFTSFDPDDLSAAHAALDAQYAEPRGNAAWAAQLRMHDAVNRRDWDGFRRAFEPDFVITDNRQGVRLRLSGHEALKAFEPLRTADHLRLDAELLATRGEHLALMRLINWFDEGPVGPSEVAVVTVVECGNDGRLRSHTTFDPDDLDAAYAALDARHAEARSNAAWMAQQRLIDALNRRDSDGTRRALDLDFVSIDRRQGVRVRRTGGDHLLAEEPMRAGDEYRSTTELLAIRGDRLALTRDTHYYAGRGIGPTDLSALCVVESGADGRVLSHIAFDPDDLDAAYSALDARYAELEGNAAWRALLRLVDAQNRRDWDALAYLLDPDFVSIDNRQGIRLTTRGAGAMDTFDTMRGIESFRIEAELLATRGDHLALARYVIWFEVGAAGPSEVAILCLVESLPDGRTHSHTAFDPDDVDAAYAALDARHAELASGNRATRAIAEQDDALTQRDLDRFLACFDPAFEYDDRRSGVAIRLVGQDAIASSRVLFEMDVATLRRQVIATLGDRVAVTEVHMRGSDGAVGEIESSAVNVLEAGEDGRLTCLVAFDIDEREQALSEMRRRHTELAAGTAQPTPNLVTRNVVKQDEAFTRRDVEGWRACFDPALEWDDRRSGVGLRLIGAEAIANMQVLLDMDQATLERRFLATLGDRLAVLETHFRGSDGAVGPIEVLAVNAMEVADDGRMIRILIFDLHERDRALAEMRARFVELADPLGIQRNRAARMVEQDGWTLIASIEEDLCIHTTPDGVMLHEVDESGTVVATITYGPEERVAAANELQRRFGEHHNVAPSINAMTSAMNARDPAAVRACLADSAVIEDHRQLRVTDFQGPDSYVEHLAGTIALTSEYLVELLRVDAVEPWGNVGLVRMSGTLTDGGTFETWCRSLSVHSGGLVVHVEVFEPEDVDAAVARLREFAS